VMGGSGLASSLGPLGATLGYIEEYRYIKQQEPGGTDNDEGCKVRLERHDDNSYGDLEATSVLTRRTRPLNSASGVYCTGALGPIACIGVYCGGSSSGGNKLPHAMRSCGVGSCTNVKRGQKTSEKITARTSSDGNAFGNEPNAGVGKSGVSKSIGAIKS
jgi:hypothetical protein